jgi:hypothetical protein
MIIKYSSRGFNGERLDFCTIFIFLLYGCTLTNSSDLSSKKGNQIQTSKDVAIAQNDCFAEWGRLYSQNKSLIDDVSRCVFANKQKAIVGLIYYDVERKYAMIGIEGFFDEYVMSDELQSSSLFLNFERKIKKKNLERNPVSGKISLLSDFVSCPSDGFGLVFGKDSIIAVRPQIIGDFDLSDDFVRDLHSCAN